MKAVQRLPALQGRQFENLAAHIAYRQLNFVVARLDGTKFALRRLAILGISDQGGYGATCARQHGGNSTM